ncbi:hypothetical protein B0H17DRAFT_1124853 [Mycena rosella]|uniref:Uncharacterized protein n=1 Tax=Mycena rosella TaxID=1033263 RepID=A0AAD7MAP7_MYCRO|nr:hypothetical protein B0H17DRAFT_1124853 [Mycena rosella]
MNGSRTSRKVCAPHIHLELESGRVMVEDTEQCFVKLVQEFHGGEARGKVAAAGPETEDDLADAILRRDCRKPSDHKRECSPGTEGNAEECTHIGWVIEHFNRLMGAAGNSNRLQADRGGVADIVEFVGNVHSIAVQLYSRCMMLGEQRSHIFRKIGSSLKWDAMSAWRMVGG